MREIHSVSKVLIAGSGGQLGRELLKRVPSETECLGVDLPEVDITSGDQVRRLCADFRPDLLINAAAYTAVDRAEKENAAARAVNVDGAGNLAAAAEEAGARVIHVSTDFVFDGYSRRPYLETDPPGPLGVYGRTKLSGEREVTGAAPRAVIVRTSWLYSIHGNNFVKTMLRLMAEGQQVKVVCDQVGSPTWAGGLAVALWEIAGNPGMQGVYHWADLGEASWYEFASAIREEAMGLGIMKAAEEVLPVSTREYPTLAQRPAYSVMDTSKIRAELGIPGVPWRENLRTMLRELRQ